MLNTVLKQIAQTGKLIELIITILAGNPVILKSATTHVSLA